MNSVLVLAFITSISVSYGEIRTSPQGYRLQQQAGYLIVAPRTVRPNQIYRVEVTVYRLNHPRVIARASLSRDGNQYAYQQVAFTEPSTRMLEMQVPKSLSAGRHRLRVEGLLDVGAGNALFTNETDLHFESKYVSVFIETDKPLYYAGQPVSFRVVAVSPDSLKPVFGSITIYVRDAKRNIVRRWLQKQLIVGVFSSQFDITYPVNVGEWTIEVEGFGHRYEQPFKVEFFYFRRIEVNVTTPLYMTNTEWGLVGTVYGEKMSGTPGHGNITIQLRVREQSGRFVEGELEKRIRGVSKEVPFDFSMDEINQKFGKVTGKDLIVKAWFYDWELFETQNGTARTKVIQDGVKVKVIGRRLRTFKSGFPFTVYFAVQRLDGTPYQGFFDRIAYVQVIHEGSATRAVPVSKLVIPDDNVIRYDVTPNRLDKRVRVRCWIQSGEKSPEEVILYRYYSPRAHFVSLTTSTKEPEVNSYVVFTVRTNVFVKKINYMIVAKGNILVSNALHMTSQQKTFAVAASREMAPVAKLVAYFVYEGEVEADSLSFFVRDSRLYEASLELNGGKDFTGDTLEVITRGTPGGYMTISGVDYELYKRGSRPFLHAEKVLDDLRSYDGEGQGPYQHIWYHNDLRWESSHFFTSPTGGMDTLQTFQLAGLYVFSDLNFTGQSYEDNLVCNKTLGFYRCPGGACYYYNKTCDGYIDCPDGYDEIACPMEDRDVPVRRKPDLDDLHRQVRHYNDMEWLWKSAYIMPVGRTEVHLTVPETMDPYVISGFVIHPEEGLAVVNNYVMHDTTRTFFMTVEMPENSRRGEQIGIRCSLFNFQVERIEVIVMLHGGENYRFVNVEENGYVNSYTPRTSEGDVQTMVLLESGEMRHIHFPVVPIIESGEITVTISAHTFLDSDTEERTLSIVYDGVENADYTPYLIDLVNQGSIIIPDFDIPIPPQFVDPELPFHLYVPGSQSAVTSLFGDVVSPGFYEDYYTSELLTGLPHDSAEGYMVDFAINVQTLKYLQATHALTSDALAKVLQFTKSLLMRQYAYMNDDGSFKMFRRMEKPCLWVTAFVCRSIHEAVTSEWDEELYVESALLNKIALWISRQQDPSGAFIETAGALFDRNMDPYSEDKDGVRHEWHVALTAYVTITLSALTRVSGDAKTHVLAARDKAAIYLATKYNHVTDPYDVAVIAYALHVAQHKESYDVLLRLHQIRREGEGVYWAKEEYPSNPTYIVNTVHIMEPRPDYTDLGRATTATSYGLMLYLQRQQEPWKSTAIPIMKWLQSQRMGMTIWSSTQDTLVALQALTAFALSETNRHIYQMEVTMRSTFNPDFKVTRSLNSSTFASLYVDEIPLAHGQVKASAKGTGYAMLQVDSFHHVERPFQQANPDYESYHVQLVNAVYYGRNASVADLTFCIEWTRPDITNKTGMTFVSIAVPTGFVVSRDTIERMYRAGTPGLHRVRFRDGFLITFFDYVVATPTCFETRIERWFPVANVSIQYIISAFEYAETGCQNNTLYTAWTLTHLHICQVCGSFQCPYCLNYNNATWGRPSVLLVTLAVALVTMLIFRSGSYFPPVDPGMSTNYEWST